MWLWEPWIPNLEGADSCAQQNIGAFTCLMPGLSCEFRALTMAGRISAFKGPQMKEKIIA
jgi:hypothetical protein